MQLAAAMDVEHTGHRVADVDSHTGGRSNERSVPERRAHLHSQLPALQLKVVIDFGMLPADYS
jgi:hypothetical protein